MLIYSAARISGGGGSKVWRWIRYFYRPSQRILPSSSVLSVSFARHRFASFRFIFTNSCMLSSLHQGLML